MIPAPRTLEKARSCETRVDHDVVGRVPGPCRWLAWVTFAVLCLAPGFAAAAPPLPDAKVDTLNLSVRDMEVTEVFEMLSRSQRANILLSKDVTGPVSVYLYDADLDSAVRAVAEAGGFGVEVRTGSYVVLKRDDVGKDVAGAVTQIRSFKVQYSDPKVTAEILEKHLSRYGQVTVLEDRDLLVVQELPDFMVQLEALINEIDVQPKQILIEAKVLEISLDDSESLGFDWKRLFRADGGEGSFGTQGLSLPKQAGLFFQFANRNLDLALDALTTRGRVRTLSSPKLMALENEEASVIIGDRLGYKVTTTINQVTTESIEFLESGVILRVTPSVDHLGRILLEIHPEVSTGSVDEGIPSKTTTAVNTQLLAGNGQTIFIGGLMKNRTVQNRSGVPGLGRIPFVGRLFSRTEDVNINTETIVLITPRIVDETLWQSFAEQGERVEEVSIELGQRGEETRQVMASTRRVEETLVELSAEEAAVDAY